MRIENPVLTGFHPDPSMVRVGDEYFIANSTFEWYPGVEINRSKDLKNWTSVPSPLSVKRLLDMTGEKFSCGIWAPCLSYSDGMFWLIYTNVRNWDLGPWKDCPNFLTTAPSIEGPWSDPVFMNASGFDSSMFHDDDGKHWYINMEWDFRQTGFRQFSGILMQEYDPTQKKLIGTRKKIFLGTDIGLVEGPHLYKRNGWYYIAAAEGGTSYEHAISVGRSRNIEGPYEVHPHNPLITSYNHPELKIQKAGHGSWVDSPDGTKYFLAYLCGRPLEGRYECPLGRETGIAEMVWKDDWPYLLQSDGSLGNNPTHYIDVPWDEVKPVDAKVPESNGDIIYNYTFNNSDFWKDFKVLRMPATEDRFSIKKRPGFLRMTGGQSPWSFYEQGLVARRQTEFSFEAETKIEFEPDYFQQMAGLCYRYDEETQYLLAVTHDENKGKVLIAHVIMPNSLERGFEIPLEENKPVWLKVSVDKHHGFFSYSTDGKIWHQIRPRIDAWKISDEHAGMGFTGAFVGMFCVDGEFYSKYADFEYFKYTAKKA